MASFQENVTKMLLWALLAFFSQKSIRAEGAFRRLRVWLAKLDVVKQKSQQLFEKAQLLVHIGLFNRV